jgi:hypothetical protein
VCNTLFPLLSLLVKELFTFFYCVKPLHKMSAFSWIYGSPVTILLTLGRHGNVGDKICYDIIH